MAVALVGCTGDGFSVAASNILRKQVRSRPSPTFYGLYPIGRNSYRFPFGQCLDHPLVNKRNVEVRVAADYSDSKPESFKHHGKWDYHPLEDLSKVEQEKLEHAGDGKLTNAEMARTISEVNWNAIIFSSIYSGKDAVFETEVQFLVDDHGDLYFEVDNDNDFLRTLSTTQIYTVLVGYGNGDVQSTQIIVGEVEGESDAETDLEEDSFDEGDISDIEIYWEGVEDVEDMEDTSEESFGSLGGWGGYSSLEKVHPMEFATKVSEAASADHIAELDKPSRRLTISGVVRPVTQEEEPYVQGIWYDRFLVTGENDGDKDAKENSLNHNEEKGEIAGKDQGGGVTDTEKLEVSGGSYNGILSKSVNGNANLSHDRDLGLSSNLHASSELSSSDHSIIELPSSSANSAEGLGAIRDVSRELGKRKNRNVDRGSLTDDSDMKDDVVEVEPAEIVLPHGATLDGDALVDEWPGHERDWTQSSQSSLGRANFYKLEIVSILLDAAPGVQSNIEIQDFAYAEPDILAHSSSAIMDRINGGGKKTENALKALCQRAKGLNVEEVSVVGIDCLGIDLRVRCGIEVQSLRIPFTRRATSEETADKFLDQLLFPQIGQRRARKRSQDWNSQR